MSEDTRTRDARRRRHPLMALSGLAFLCGCSTFEREWKAAPSGPMGAGDITGRWEGSWVSDKNGHSGNLRCVLTREEGGRYRAHFKATFLKILRYAHATPFTVERYDETAATTFFSGEEDLGWLAGGLYRYEGKADGQTFHCTYDSKYDFGRFEMKRGE